uniref:Uncharacterized protein n=1 Tax=Romanomermis culicivorax TaxID=13658 RepID=A0A915HW05_ROMCU
MAKRINLPSDFWYTASAERSIQKSVTQRHLIDNTGVMSCGLVVLNPTTAYKFELTWKTMNKR